MRQLLELYSVFARIGCVTFGGGYAMLPILERELVSKRSWCTMDELRDYFAIGQCTPGIIALNVSTFIGEKRGGVKGAVVATTGFLTGPVAIILIIAMFLKNFAQLPLVQHAFAGIRVAVCALILSSIVKLAKSTLKRWWHWLLMFGGFVVVASGFSPVLVVATCAVLGLLLGRKVKLHE